MMLNFVKKPCWQSLFSPIYRSSSSNSKHTVEFVFEHLCNVLYENDKADTLSFGQATDSIEQDVMLLMYSCLKLDPKSPLVNFFDDIVPDSSLREMRQKCRERLVSQKPMAYIVKKAVQQGEIFDVDERVLIPRSFIGEILFEDCLWNPRKSKEEKTKSINSGRFLQNKNKIRRVLDLCTGSACLSILCSRVFPNLEHIDCVDISEKALEVARMNVCNKNLDHLIHIHQGNMFEPLKTSSSAPRYDLIICNPPYVDAHGMKTLPLEYQKEPSLALDGGKDGMKIIRQLMSESSSFLNDQGGILVEVGRTFATIEREYPQLFFRAKKPLVANNITSLNKGKDERLPRPLMNDNDALEGRRTVKAVWLNTELSKKEVFYASKEALRQAKY